MAQDSAIEWTDATWNPVTGCTKSSPGCKNCCASNGAPTIRQWGGPKKTRTGRELAGRTWDEMPEADLEGSKRIWSKLTLSAREAI
jgi:protein gp37